MTEMSPFAMEILRKRYLHPGETSWADVAKRVATNVMGAVNASPSLVAEVEDIIATRRFIPGGRYLYATGQAFHQTQNCLLLRANDTREGWGELADHATRALMTGAGVGVVYSDLREEGVALKSIGGYASGPIALMQMINECGRYVRQGGSRRAAIWAGLHWNHPDALKFVKLKNWSAEMRALKDQDMTFAMPMELTNISIILDDEFFKAYKSTDHAKHAWAREVYSTTVKTMLKTAEPGFSIDTGPNTGENLRNACTEVTSHDDSDICNLGSINLARINSVSEMRRVVELATAFLCAGTVYSHVPYPRVREVRDRNRRLGLGLMGLHEWLLANGKSYGPDETLKTYLQEYAYSGAYANGWADDWSLSRPVKTRAVAPTGTIGIIGETTTGVEPIFCVAYRRRYIDREERKAQYVLDPTAKRLVAQGVDPNNIEDAYTIPTQRRLEFQAWLQTYVDHAISSTINLPSWGSPLNNESTVDKYGQLMMDYLPDLRGLTCYPDGARGGQPLSRVDWNEALVREGEVIVESGDVCDLRGGSCGS